MLARPQMSQNEWNTTERGGFYKLAKTSHPCPAPRFVRAILEPAVRTTLRTLCLESCGLSGRAIISLAEAFNSPGDDPAALHKLNLARNGIDGDSAVSLGAG